MKIIDAHLHFSEIKRFRNCAKTISKVEYSSEGLIRDFKQSRIVCGIAMGVEETKDKAFPDENQHNPMGINLESNIPISLRYCLGINPYMLRKNTDDELHNIEKKLQEDQVVGVKLYPGYYPISVDDPIYSSVYILAERYRVPVVVHCGKTYSVKGYLHESHPLIVNKVALKYPKLKFVIAHLGDPWVMDTAAIISNNSNVYSDLSGLIVGNEDVIRKRGRGKLFKEHIKMALEYANSYEQILFGSDWPLTSYRAYISWIKELIPEEHHENVFYNNAIKVYDKMFIHK